MTSPIPSGFHSLTPGIIVDGAARALDFYERAFGAEVTLRLAMGDLVAHAEVRIGDSMVYVNDPMPRLRAASRRPPSATRGRRRC